MAYTIDINPFDVKCSASDLNPKFRSVVSLASFAVKLKFTLYRWKAVGIVVEGLTENLENLWVWKNKEDITDLRVGNSETSTGGP